MLKAALRWARRDFKVIPLIGKVPAVKGGRGHRDASSDLDQIRKWWGEYPGANIGLAMRSNDLVALDIDPRNEGDKTLKRLIKEHGSLPNTWVQATGGGGQHYIFRHDGLRYLSPGDGIDIKDDGYIVIAPSIHPDTGKAYYWETPLDRRRLKAVPEWLQHTSPRSFHTPSPIKLEGDPVFQALRRLGRVHFDERDQLNVGFAEGGTEKTDITCPWINEHSEKVDNGSAYFAGGGFKCHHAHCDGRGIKELCSWIGEQGEDIESIKRDQSEVIEKARLAGISAMNEILATEKPLFDLTVSAATKSAVCEPGHVKKLSKKAAATKKAAVKKSSAKGARGKKPKVRKSPAEVGVTKKPGVKAKATGSKNTSVTAAAAKTSVGALPTKPRMPKYPPGLVGSIARIVETRLPYKMKNIPLAAALIAVARMNNHQSVVVAPGGRKTPLNLFVLLTAQTGSGKETARDILNDLGQAIANEPLVEKQPASSQALGRMISKNLGTSLLLYMDEYGKRLAHAATGSGAFDNAVNALLLELYGLALGTYAGRAYAKEKDDVKGAEFPYVNLLAATTIEPLSDALSDASVFDGTLNRFLYLPQPEKLIRNENQAFGPISEQIVNNCKKLWNGNGASAEMCEVMELVEAPNTVKIGKILFRKIKMSGEAHALFDQFDRGLDKAKERGGALGALAARATEQAIRIAGVVALGCARNLDNMVLETRHAEYGIGLIQYTTHAMLQFVDDEIVGADPRNLTRRIMAFLRVCVDHPEEAKIPKDRERWREYNREGFVPHSQFVLKFKREKNRDRKDALETLIESGDVHQKEAKISGQPLTLYQPSKSR